MSSDTQKVINGEVPELPGFGAVEKDAIGEIQNITMGSAATAVSNLLDAKVWITTPRVAIVKTSELDFPNLEPAVNVKIEYIKGVSGSSVLVLKQSDVQLILDQLMGMPLVVTDDFEFDEMNISAVCEVMNQMMGASATALAELINVPVDISTPEAVVSKDGERTGTFNSVTNDEYCVEISFNLTIDGVINSEFISVLSIDLAKMMAEKMLSGYGEALEETMNQQTSAAEPAPTPTASTAESSGGGTLSQEEIEKMMAAANSSDSEPAYTPPPAPSSSGGTLTQEEIERMLAGNSPVQQQAAAPQQPQRVPQPQPQQEMQQPYPQYAQQPYPPYPQQGMYGAYPPQSAYPPPYGYPQQPAPQQVQKASNVNVQNVSLHNFDSFDDVELTSDQTDNLKLLMGVPLEVTVEIGSTKRKVKDILNFSQGTIIELERQAGAPVDVIVNGHLIAKGDVVVIEDNFAVRITEIIKSKFLDNLGNKE